MRKKWCPLLPLPQETIPTDPYSYSTCPKISQWISFTCNLGACQTSAFAPRLRANDIMHTHFKNGVSVSCCFLTVLYQIPFSFQSQMLWSSSCQCKAPWLVEPNTWSLVPLFIRGGSLQLWYPSLVCVAAPKGVSLEYTTFPPLLSVLMWLSLYILSCV